MPHFSKEQIQEANRTNLIEYAKSIGYELEKPSGGACKVKGYGGLFVFERGFCHHSEDKKGNVIQFLMEYENKTFPQAVEDLLGGRAYEPIPYTSPKQQYSRSPPPKPPQEDFHYSSPPPEDFHYSSPPPEEFYSSPPPEEFYYSSPPPEDSFYSSPPPEEYSYADIPPHNSYSRSELPQNHQPFSPKERGTLELPENNPNTFQVEKYLTGERCLDSEIVKDLLQKGDIFQAKTYRGEFTFANCAFVGFDNQKQVKFCSLRSMGRAKFRQDVANSDKSYPFVMKGRSNRLFVCESPIDVVSHATLTKMNNNDYTEDSRISLGGLSDKALERFLSDNPQITSIVFALDNDKDGLDTRGNPHNHGQVFAEKCSQLYGERGYKTMIQTPKGKDFNEDLQNIVMGVREQKAQTHQQNRPPPQGQHRPPNNFPQRKTGER
ncbi:MAG: toprim domain-containing protein [Eubacteriales bacterium]